MEQLPPKASPALSLSVAFLSLLLASGASHSQEPEPSPLPSPPPGGEEKLTARTLEDLIASLEDTERRGKLLQELRALLAAHQAARAAQAAPASEEGLAGSMVALFRRVSNEIRTTLVQMVEEGARIPGHWRSFRERLASSETRTEFLVSCGKVAGIVLVALGLAMAAGWPLRGARARLRRAPAATGRFTILSKVFRLLGLAILEAVPPAVLFASGFAALSLAVPSETARLICLIILSALTIFQSIKAVLGLVLAPGADHLRLLSMGEERALTVKRSLTGLAALTVFGSFLLQALAAAGAAQALLRPLTRVYGFVLLISGIAFVLRQRGPMRSYLERREASPQASITAPPPERAGRFGKTRSLLYSILGMWWLVTITYLVGLYLVWAGGRGEDVFQILRPGLLTALIIAVAAGASVTVRGLVGQSGNWASRSLASYAGLQARVPIYARGLHLVLHTAIVVLAICFTLEAWGLAALAALESTAGKNLISAAVGILLTILLALAVIDVVTVFTERFLELREREGKATGKVKTLVPLVRSVVKLVVAVVASLMILSEIGVQVGPLLAGVGILGLAVGFGAQTLVKDVITGFFILLEDSVGVGEVASVNGTAGQVEAINLRSIRLRDLSGNVHTIPFSAVQTVTNMTKGFSKYLVEAAVAYDEDVDEVTEVLKQVGDELQQDPEFGKDILEPIEILGLDRFEDSAVIVRARLTTKPIQQWRVGREYNRRMKRAFEARGIEMPFPTRTIELKDGRGQPLRLGSGDPADADTKWKDEPKYRPS